MKLTEKLQDNYKKSFFEKNGDRITGVQGNILATKIVTQKSILWLYHKFVISFVVKPEKSSAIVKCEYKKNQFFSKPSFINLSVGNYVLVSGLKSLKKEEVIEVVQIQNFTTKKEFPDTGNFVPVKRTQQFKRK